MKFHVSTGNIIGFGVFLRGEEGPMHNSNGSSRRASLQTVDGFGKPRSFLIERKPPRHSFRASLCLQQNTAPLNNSTHTSSHPIYYSLFQPFWFSVPCLQRTVFQVFKYSNLGLIISFFFLLGFFLPSLPLS